MSQNTGMKVHNNPIYWLLLISVIFEKNGSPENLVYIRTQRLPLTLEMKDDQITNQSLPDEIREILVQLGLTFLRRQSPETSTNYLKLGAKF